MKVVRHVLLPLSAFAIVYGGLAALAGAMFFQSADRDFVDASSLALKVGGSLLFLGIFATVVAFSVARRGRSFWRVFRLWLTVATLMVVPTAVLFGPLSGFHHNYGFGIPYFFLYMVWNGENPSPDGFQIMEGYEVYFNPFRFCVLLAVWLIVLAVVALLVGPSQGRNKDAEA